MQTHIDIPCTHDTHRDKTDHEQPEVTRREILI